MKHQRNVELTSSDGRFLLRPPDIEGASAHYEAVLISKEDLMPWMDWCKPDFSIDVINEFLLNLPKQWEEAENYAFGIFDTNSGQFLGICGLNQINQQNMIANLGYWVRSDRTGEGIASDAVRIVAEYGFQELGLRRIEIVTGIENWASRRVAEKTGAHYEGILRKRTKIGDNNVDAAMYSLIPEDF